MNVHNVALDVGREAIARRYVAAVAGIILLGQLGVLLALDIDVVEGVIVSTKLFGEAVKGDSTGSAAELMGPVLRALVHLVFHLGTLFGIVATSDIAVRLLSPGRVELALSLPIRRWELAVGIYLGVLVLALVGYVFAVGGFSAILFYKAEFATIAPFIGAVCAALGFATVYATMLFASTLIRSQAVASGAGLSLYIVSLATSNREQVASWFEAGWPRELVGVIIAPLPRLATLVGIGADMATQEQWRLAELAGVTAGAAAFAAACLGGAALVVWWRDY